MKLNKFIILNLDDVEFKEIDECQNLTDIVELEFTNYSNSEEPPIIEFKPSSVELGVKAFWVENGSLFVQYITGHIEEFKDIEIKDISLPELAGENVTATPWDVKDAKVNK